MCRTSAKIRVPKWNIVWAIVYGLFSLEEKKVLPARILHIAHWMLLASITLKA
jgi:hypothetical protein